MKKILFASTALVAAGLLTAGNASASSKIHLQLGGHSQWWVVGAWESNSFLSANNYAIPNVDVKGENAIDMSGSTTLDNGLKVGAKFEFRGGDISKTTTDTIDQSFAWVEGGFGKFLIGSDKSVNYQMAVTAPVANGQWNEGGLLTGDFVLFKPGTDNIMAGGNTTKIDTLDHATHIQYQTPSLYGFTLGLGYTPQYSEDNRNPINLNNSFDVGTTTTANPSGTINASDATLGYSEPVQQSYEANLLYVNSFNGIGVKADAGVLQAKLGRVSGGGASSWLEQQFGAQLSYAGITIGGSYRHQQANYTETTNTDLASLGALTSASSGSMGHGNAYDAGIQYATGPYGVSFSYYHSSVAACDMSSGCSATHPAGVNDVTKFYELAGKYNLGPGVDILTTAGYGEYNSVPNEAKYNNSGWVAMSGLSLAF